MADRSMARRRRLAFTLIELLVVIAIIGILASLLLPSLSSAKRKGSQAMCINNEKQLALGMHMYLDDNADTFPGIASGLYGFHPEDWIYWRTNTALYPSFKQSPIFTTLPGAGRTLLRCPLDTDDSYRLAKNVSDGPYLFSYSLTGYGVRDGRNVGISSVIETVGGVTNIYRFKESDVRNPSMKIMFAEEPGTPADSGNGSDFIYDGRWIPVPPDNKMAAWADPLTTRHNGRADVTFADGHVQAVRPFFGIDPLNSQPDL